MLKEQALYTSLSLHMADVPILSQCLVIGATRRVEYSVEPNEPVQGRQ